MAAVQIKLFLGILLLLLKLNNISGQDEEPEEGPSDENKKTNSSSFIKLDLPLKYLDGARWEIETKNISKIFHCVDIIDISDIDVANGDLRINLNLRQRWTESNLHFREGLFLENETDSTSITADSGILGALWVPDLYIPNSKTAQVEKLLSPHINVVIYKNKTIMLYATITSKISCPMQFQWYPLDIQKCELQLESYTYTDNKVLFVWDDQSPPVTITKIKLRRYALGDINWGIDKFPRFGRTESYSRITVIFTFEREIANNLINVFIPTFLIISLSWFSFWLGLDAIPGRVGLLVTCMLTMVTMYTGLKADLPPVAYVKILDIWMAAGLLFIFAAMSEFIVVRTIHHAQKDKNESQNEEKLSIDPTSIEACHEHGHQQQKKQLPTAFVIDNMEKYNHYNHHQHHHGSHFTASPYDEFYTVNRSGHSNNIMPISRNAIAAAAGGKNNGRFTAAWDIPLYNNGTAAAADDSYERLRLNNRRQRLFTDTPDSNTRSTGIITRKNSDNQLLHVQYQGQPWKSRKRRKQQQKKKASKNLLWERIDKASRIAFPLLFFCFCLVYWPILIFGSKIQKNS